MIPQLTKILYADDVIYGLSYTRFGGCIFSEDIGAKSKKMKNQNAQIFMDSDRLA